MKKKLFFKCQRGASAVEFAIVLPLLLAFVFGIIEFGILLYNKAVITNASREGARAASLFYIKDDPANSIKYIPATAATGDPSVEKVVKDYCANHLISFGGSNIPTVTTTGQTGTSPNKYRSVTVNFNYKFLVLPNILALIKNGNMSDPITLTAQAQMRTESQ